jgi:hypothetical protein
MSVWCMHKGKDDALAGLAAGLARGVGQVETATPPTKGPGELSPGGATVLALAIAGAGAYGGYLVGSKVGAPRHKLAGGILGAIAGWIVVPAVVGGIAGAVAGSAPVVAKSA